MSGLGMSIMLEGEARGITIGEARGITIGEARGEARGEEKGFALGAEVFKAVQSGAQDNMQIAMQCGCTPEKVEKIRKAFGI